MAVREPRRRPVPRAAIVAELVERCERDASELVDLRARLLAMYREWLDECEAARRHGRRRPPSPVPYFRSLLAATEQALDRVLGRARETVDIRVEVDLADRLAAAEARIRAGAAAGALAAGAEDGVTAQAAEVIDLEPVPEEPGDAGLGEQPRTAASPHGPARSPGRGEGAPTAGPGAGGPDPPPLARGGDPA